MPLLPPDAGWHFPAIGRSDLPAAIRHLIDRVYNHALTIADLNELRGWIELKPEIPDGDCYKDFCSFKTCGKGPYSKNFCSEGT